MKIRCRDPHDGKQYTLSVEPAWPVSRLRQQLLQNMSLPATTALQFKKGVAPFTRLSDDGSRTLDDEGVTHGDTLLIDITGRSLAGDTAGNANNDNAEQFVRCPIPDDNSCLFNAIGFVLLNQARDQSNALRLLIAEAVRAHPDIYTAAMLGTTSVAEYCRLITGPMTWGGAIELAIFAQHFSTEIVSIDVETLKPYHFGEGAGYANRVFLLYSGIHYDAVAQRSNASGQWRTLFASDDGAALGGALSVAAEEQRARRFTNTASFTLQCAVCKVALVGQTEAQDHCRLTGHPQFAEYAPAANRP